jgi:integrase
MYVVKTNKKGPKKWEAGLPRVGRTLPRKYFETKAQAEAYIALKKRERENLGLQSLTLTDAERSDYKATQDKLAKAGLHVSLAELADYYIQTHQPISVKPLAAAADEFLEEKRNSGCKPRSVQELKQKLAAFQLQREAKTCDSITTQEVREFINGQGWSTSTRRGWITDLRTFFTWCQKQRYSKENPAQAIDKPRRTPTPPRALTIPQIKALLTAGLKTDPELTGGYIAPLLFGGPRRSEALQLAGQNIGEAHIDIEATKAKTRRRRVIEASPQLQEWMKLCKKWPVKNFNRRIERVRKAAAEELHGKGTKEPFPWPKNCLRHSFCSYSMQVHGARATAEAAGHSEQMLFNTYRAIVTRAEAQEWERLTPSALNPTAERSGQQHKLNEQKHSRQH